MSTTGSPPGRHRNVRQLPMAQVQDGNAEMNCESNSGNDMPRRNVAEKFSDEDADHVERRESTWLVKGLWPRSGVCFIAGPSMSGKSFWVLDQASRIANGREVLGRRSAPSGTIY